MKTMIGPALCVCSTLIAGSFYSVAALADEASTVRSLAIDTHGLDLTRPQDVRTLQARVKRAAQEVCGPEPYIVTPDRPGYLGYETCYRRALMSAQARVDALVRDARSRHERLAQPEVRGEGQSGPGTDR